MKRLCQGSTQIESIVEQYKTVAELKQALAEGKNPVCRLSSGEVTNLIQLQKKDVSDDDIVTIGGGDKPTTGFNISFVIHRHVSLWQYLASFVAEEGDFCPDRFQLFERVLELFKQTVGHHNFHPNNIQLKLNEQGQWDRNGVDFHTRGTSRRPISPGFEAPEQFHGGPVEKSKVLFRHLFCVTIFHIYFF